MSQPTTPVDKLLEAAFEEGWRLYRDLIVFGRAVARDGTVWVWDDAEYTRIVVKVD